MSQRLDATELAQVLALIRQGLSDAAIAKKMGVSRQTINDVRNQRTHKKVVR